MRPGSRATMLLRMLPVVLLHGLTVIGLIALLARSIASLRASFYYDPLFDGWSIRFMVGGVALVVGPLVVAAIWWIRTGNHRPLVAVDLFIVVWLLFTVSARTFAKGSVTLARALPLGVALIALVAASSVIRAARGQPKASSDGPLW